MRLATCPSCGQKLKLDTPAGRVRVRCPACGSDVEAVILEPTPPKPYGRRPKAGPPRWPVVVVAGCTAGVMAGVILLWYLANYRQVEVRNPDSGVVLRERMTVEDAERLRGAIETEYQAKRAEAVRDIAEAEPAAEAPAGTVDYMSTRDAAGRREAHLPFAVEIAPDSDQAIELTFSAPRAGMDGAYVLPVLAGNNHGTALGALTITAELANAGGARIATLTASCEQLPAGGKAGLVMALAGVSLDEVASMTLSASGKPADPDQQCWQADSGDYEVRVSGARVLVAGRISSPGGGELHDVSVACDFYTAGGEYIGSSPGRLVGESISIPAGLTSEFEAQFDPSPSGFLPEAVAGASLRIVGRTPS